MSRNRFSILYAILMSILMFSFCGCDSGGSDSHDSTPATTSSASSSSYIGSWAMHPGTEASGTIDFYIHFNSDKSFTISRNPDKSDQIIYGTYTIDGSNFLEGPMVNPGVGDGKVECRISNGVITMDFIEYWHEPAKHLAFACNKIS